MLFLIAPTRRLIHETDVQGDSVTANKQGVPPPILPVCHTVFSDLYRIPMGYKMDQR
jgi:hypothetical protein